VYIYRGQADKKVRHSTFDWYGVAIPNFGLVWRPPYLPYRFRRPCTMQCHTACGYFDMLSGCPKPVEISGAVNGSAAVGTALTCTGARDHLWSPSSYLWINVDDGTTVTGDSFTVADKKLYKLTCTVYYSSPGDTGNVTCSSHGSFEVTGR